MERLEVFCTAGLHPCQEGTRESTIFFEIRGLGGFRLRPEPGHEEKTDRCPVQEPDPTDDLQGSADRRIEVEQGKKSGKSALHHAHRTGYEHKDQIDDHGQRGEQIARPEAQRKLQENPD